MSNINLQDSSEENLLNKFGKDSGFKVPDGYFDELSASIQNRISTEKNTRWNFSLGFLAKPQLIAAFSILLIVGLIILFNSGNDYKIINSIADENANVLAEQVLLVEDIDEHTILSMFDENATGDFAAKAASIYGSDEELSDDEILNYLSNEDLSELTVFLP